MPKKQHQKLGRSSANRRSPSPTRPNSAAAEEEEQEQQRQQQQDDEDKRAIAISAKLEAASNVYRPPTPVNHSVTTAAASNAAAATSNAGKCLSVSQSWILHSARSNPVAHQLLRAHLFVDLVEWTLGVGVLQHQIKHFVIVIIVIT